MKAGDGVTRAGVEAAAVAGSAAGLTKVWALAGTAWALVVAEPAGGFVWACAAGDPAKVSNVTITTIGTVTVSTRRTLRRYRTNAERSSSATPRDLTGRRRD